MCLLFYRASFCTTPMIHAGMKCKVCPFPSQTPPGFPNDRSHERRLLSPHCLFSEPSGLQPKRRQTNEIGLVMHATVSNPPTRT